MISAEELEKHYYRLKRYATQLGLHYSDQDSEERWLVIQTKYARHIFVKVLDGLGWTPWSKYLYEDNNVLLPVEVKAIYRRLLAESRLERRT